MRQSVTSVDDNGPLITYTVFTAISARDKTEYSDAPWTDLVRMLADPPTYLTKRDCPLLSLCEYGDATGEGGGLRHASNVRRVYGIEVDYDDEEVSVDEGEKRLHAAGLAALIYTSASYTDGAPRWRAILPLSEPAAPIDRAKFVARANRALGGIASRESFTLSQSFYFGKVRGAKYIVRETRGRCIDQAADLEPLFHQSQGTDPKSGRDTRSNQQLIEAFKRGEGRYEAMLKLSSRWAARGMEYDDVVAALEDLLASSGSSLNADGIDLRSRVKPMAASAVRKFAGTVVEARIGTQVPEVPEDLPPFNVNDWMDVPEAQGMVRVREPEVVAMTPSGIVDVMPGMTGDTLITAKRWSPIKPADIPPRQWLYGFHYMRRMVSMTAGAGGGGKSSMVMVEAVSMSIGRDLLRGKWMLPTGRLGVWVHNGEDPEDELQRRLAAICMHYGVDAEEVAERFYLTSGRDTRVIVAEEIDGQVVQIPGVREQLVQQMREQEISVLILDPFISTHAVNENSNPAMEKVMWEWRAVAEQANCAIELVHHFRKGNGNESTGDDVRGASAVAGACRSVRIASPMTKGEAEQYSVNPDERRRHFWLQNPKANMRPPSDERVWRRLESVELGNATGIYEEGDKVGVVIDWSPPTAESAITPGQKAAVLRDMEQAAAKDPLANRIDPRSSLWAGRVLARHMEYDPDDAQAKNTLKRILESWVSDGTLKRGQARDHVKARYCPVFYVAESQQGKEADEETPF
jgi:hypothetical protein